MKKLFLILFLVLTVPCAVIRTWGQDDNRLPDNAGDLLLQVNYEGIVRSDIMCTSYNNKVYLPFLDILSKLRIYYDYNYTQKTIEGYFITKDSTFSVDFRTGTCYLKSGNIQLLKDDFLTDKTEIYVQPEIFKRIFGFKIEVSYLRLTANIESDIELPIKQAYKRFKGYSFLDQKKGNSQEDYGPLLYDRKRSLLNGGTLNYVFRANQTNNIRSYIFSGNLGMEVLGGDFQVTSSGGYYENSKKYISQNYYRWRYGFGENPYLSNISVGNLTSSAYRATTLPSVSFMGVQLTNEDTKYPSFFTNMTYEEQLEPGWQVELYKNGYLVEHKTTDAQGWYRFDLPMEYGSSNIELRYYGKKGEYLVKKELVQIPNELLIPGEIKYSLNLGETESDKKKFADVRLMTGITSWLSNSFSLTKIDSSGSKLDFYNSLSFKPISGVLTSFNYHPEDIYGLNLNLWTIDWGSYRLAYTLYDKKSPLYQYGNRYSAELYLQLPQLFNLPFNFNFNVQRRMMNSNASNSISSNIYFNIGSIIFSTYYRADFRQSFGDLGRNDFSHNINFGMSYNWYEKPSFLKFLDNTNFNFSMNYDITRSSIQNARLSINQVIYKNIYLTYNINNNFGYSNGANMSLGLRMDLSGVRSSTNITTSDMKSISYDEEIQGIMGYNSNLNQMLFSNSTIFSNIGSGAANIRVFLDQNNNGKYDEGEILIPNVRVDIPQASMNQRSSGEMLQAYNLTPYARYNVIVDKTSIKNPLWIPKMTKFSFIADPNVYKAIDIPCYAGGVVEGQVNTIQGEKAEGQSGVKVHIVSRDSSYMEEIPVFSDGSFYKMGIPPGDYTAWVDSLQTAILKVEPEARYITFKVNNTDNGDFVSGVNFNLIDRNYKPAKETPVLASNSSNSGTGTKPSHEDKMVDSISDSPQETEKIVPETEDNTSIKKNTVLYFSGAKTTHLSVAMNKELDKIATYLLSHPKVKLQIAGHTDNAGSIDECTAISQKRASEVASYLFRKGIDKQRLYYTGYGSIYPAADNSTPQGKAKNRRVEIKVIE